MTPSQAERRRKRRPQRAPKDQYTTASYRRAIARGCERAGVPHWHPHQLRHNAATRIRKEFGIDGAQAVLGHRHLRVTETYAELATDKATKIMREIG